MHDAAFAFVRDYVTAHGRPSGTVVEIGGRDINGSVRVLFGDPYISTDIRGGDGVDVVADGETYQPPAPAGAVVCCEVFEHTPRGEQICANVFRMLAPGGVFLVTAAGDGRKPHSAIHGGRVESFEFYENVTRTMLASWLRDFAEVEITENPPCGDIYAVAVKGAACAS